MICPKCDEKMEWGIAIHPGYEEDARYIMPQTFILNSETIKIIDVLKCPKCGFSDDGKIR
jgi:predicted RNA-binding Zn-ribbon protein involved in translation (DUF1610 family)